MTQEFKNAFAALGVTAFCWLAGVFGWWVMEITSPVGHPGTLWKYFMKVGEFAGQFVAVIGGAFGSIGLVVTAGMFIYACVRSFSASKQTP